MSHQAQVLPSTFNVMLIKSLTSREIEVLQLISHGFSTKEIGSKLFLGSATIETYRNRLFSKFDCKNMAQLVRMGFEIGILKISS